MGFARRSFRAPAPTGIRAAVFAVGRLAYVANPNDRSVSVTLTDDGGTMPIAKVGDGTEVAILAWRPGWAGNTRYCVRATSSGVEGWLAVANLRKTAAHVPPGAPALPLSTGGRKQIVPLETRPITPVASGNQRATRERVRP
jgi:hypothetical protein